MSATTGTEIKQSPRDRIKDAELIELIKNGLVKLVLKVVKAKKNAKTQNDTYSQTLVWCNTGEPVLTNDGKIDCIGNLLFGVQPAENRNKSEYVDNDADPRFDKIEMSGGTKTSGTFGKLMLLWDDILFPKALEEFSKDPEQKDLFNNCVADAHQYCRRNAGSMKTPAPPAVQAAYKAAEDWIFPIKIRIEKWTKDKIPIPNHGRLFMTKLVEYVLDHRGIPVEREIKVNSKNINTEITRGTTMMFCMRPGNCSMRPTSAAGKVYKTFYPAFNWPHMTRIKKGSGSAIQNAERSHEEIRASLDAAGVVLTYENAQAAQQVDNGQDSDEESCDPNPVSADNSGPATSSDIAKQLAGLSV